MPPPHPDAAAHLRRARPQDAYRFLAERDVNAPAGTFYALEASRASGWVTRGGLRVGLAPYTDDDDVDRLLDALGEFLARACSRAAFR